ncbi:MAG: CpcT/CpeT family chromophore lyase [Phycisphaerales bacterium]
MKKSLWAVMALGLLGGVGPAALAAPQGAGDAVFSDAQFGAVAKLLTGSWKATGVKAGEGTADIVLSIAPVNIDTLPDAMYVEVARAEALEAPYRQAVLQFRKEGGKTYLRTYEFGTPNGEVQSLRTMWATPDAFPIEWTAEKLTATTDALVSGSGGTFTIATEKPVPSTKGGAASVSTEMQVSAGGLKVADRGLDANGKVVWGPAGGEWISFQHTESGVTVARPGDGLIVVSYPYTAKSDRTPSNDDIVTTQYIGSLGDGTVFDASYERGTPYRYQYDGRLLEGWKRAMMDARAGMKRKLIVPGPLGLKEQGLPAKKVGPNATLYFQVEVLDIQAKPKAEVPPPVEIQPDMNPAPVKPLPGKEVPKDMPKGVEPGAQPH